MPIDDDRSTFGETAQQKAERKWSNAEIVKNYREELKISLSVVPPNPSKVKVITNDDDDIKHESATRLDTVKDLRAKVKFLQDVIRSGRVHTVFHIDNDMKRQQIIAAYLWCVRQQRGRLAREKLRRIDEGRWTLTKSAQREQST